MKSRTFAVLATILLALTANASRSLAEDRYFMMVFASQAQPNIPRLAHTFATFFKTSGEENPANEKIETHTISWLPASLDIQPTRLQPETGKNLDLADSLAFAKALNTPVSSWGPFEIKKDLYDRSLKQIDLLNSGKISYIVLDRRFEAKALPTAFMPFCDVDTDKGLLETGTAHGKSASQGVVLHLERWLIPTNEDLANFYERLGLPKEIERVAPIQKLTTR